MPKRVEKRQVNETSRPYESALIGAFRVREATELGKIEDERPA